MIRDLIIAAVTMLAVLIAYAWTAPRHTVTVSPEVEAAAIRITKELPNARR